MGHNDSIQTWQLGLPPVRHLFSLLRMEPASVRPQHPTPSSPRPRSWPPVGRLPSPPRLQSASASAPSGRAPLSSSQPPPRHQAAEPPSAPVSLRLSTKRLSPPQSASASAPSGRAPLGSSRSQPRTASDPTSHSAPDRMSSCLEPPDTATWSTNHLWRPRGPLSPATTVQAKHVGNTSGKRRNGRPCPAIVCDSCSNQNSTC